MSGPLWPPGEVDWIERGARIVVRDGRYSYDGETGVVLSRAKYTALVRLDAGETVDAGLSSLKPEATLGDP
ncbi:MAG TPA: hypothetical protein VJM75_03255 [Acidimicrobiales bacterium]|nr:hypothetical protein [Acidimicrobiales bacterium]